MAANLAYWISTALLSLLYLASATLYIVKRDLIRTTLVGLGYPAYLVPLLTVVKIAAVAAILTRAYVPLSDLAYAGIFYHLLLSALAHIGVRQPRGALPAAIALVCLVVSFITQNAARDIPSPYGIVATMRHATIG
ncbi:DoxX family protein [Burkholderia sp. Ac-20344]|uniref:DoxX family protein n=1 Tax=Burkholderia sp. Ac-20344 TaxID=2703890 RepID=UPI00197B8045|nr:DoxX family protein [Burkholderia sp. Ac-20344]MBN3832544.1 DoxX family protein [Burkholderia sp. Ac-20344]